MARVVVPQSVFPQSLQPIFSGTLGKCTACDEHWESLPHSILEQPPSHSTPQGAQPKHVLHFHSAWGELNAPTHNIRGDVVARHLEQHLEQPLRGSPAFFVFSTVSSLGKMMQCSNKNHVFFSFAFTIFPPRQPLTGLGAHTAVTEAQDKHSAV